MLEDFGPYTVRPAVPADEPFIRNLHSITLRSQMPFEEAGLSEEQIVAVVNHQLDAQTLHYSVNYPHAEISIIERDGIPVARLIIIEFDDEVRLGDIMVMPEHRNNGICKHVMHTYVALGLATNRPIRLHVEKANWAVKLYEREKFVTIEDLSSHWLMEYRPEEAALRDGLS
jgi:ribosomal protein S18 acetylase RimI-like enzyme